MRISPAKPGYASYGEALDVTVRDLGTATPHIQVLKLLAWLFDTNISFVKQDCQERFLQIREQDRRYTRG